MGTPFPTHLSEYMRTIIYRVPGFIVREGDLIPIVVKDTAELRASIVTDPLSYLSEENFSDQYNLDVNFPTALHVMCAPEANESYGHIFVVIQFKEDMCSLAATDGQCVKRDHDGIEELFIVDCGDPYTPRPDERARSINAVLAAVKMEFEVTSALEKVFDRRCYRTDDDKCLYRCSPSLNAGLRVEIPLTVNDIATKSKICRILVSKIEDKIKNGSVGGQQQRAPDFGNRLEELIAALQLEQSTDESYLRLWYIQLWERVITFGKGCRPRLQLLNCPDLKVEKSHRNDISHRGVERMNMELLSSLQQKVFRIIKPRL